jgi:hypothetical protein
MNFYTEKRKIWQAKKVTTSHPTVQDGGPYCLDTLLILRHKKTVGKNANPLSATCRYSQLEKED